MDFFLFSSLSKNLGGGFYTFALFVALLLCFPSSVVFSSWFFFFFDMQICRFFLIWQMINPHFRKLFTICNSFVVWGFLRDRGSFYAFL